MQNHTNDANLQAHVNEEVAQQQQKLFEQNMSFIDKVARIEVQQQTMKEQQDRIEKHVESLQKNLTDEIRASVGGRITDINTLLIQQQDTQNKIIDIQSRQGQQIEQIQSTLQEFTKIQRLVDDHEIRIKNLEKRMTAIAELDKARVQSRTSLIIALISGSFGLIGTLLAIFLK
jgi:chromosome segregation ATPase